MCLYTVPNTVYCVVQQFGTSSVGSTSLVTIGHRKYISTKSPLPSTTGKSHITLINWVNSKVYIDRKTFNKHFPTGSEQHHL